MLIDGRPALLYEAEPRTLVKRNMARGRPPESAGSDDYFSKQMKALKEIYAPTFVLSTDEFNAGEVARRVARHVLLGAYTPTNLNTIIKRYA